MMTKKEELHDLNLKASVAGHMTKREKESWFAHLLDREGQIQIYVRKDEVGEEAYELFKQADLGDFYGDWSNYEDQYRWSVHQSRNFEILSKALRPLPDKYHGLTNVEQRYRQRYLDLISNRESFDRFET